MVLQGIPAVAVNRVLNDRDDPTAGSPLQKPLMLQDPQGGFFSRSAQQFWLISDLGNLVVAGVHDAACSEQVVEPLFLFGGRNQCFELPFADRAAVGSW